MKGSLRKRAGAWELRVDAGMVNGRRVQKSRTYRGTKKEAEAELRRMVTVAERGSDFSADKITFGAHANRWFDGKRALKPRATARYRELLDRHILPVIGSLPLTKLRPDHVQDVLNEARASGLSEQTALHIYRCLFAVLRQAVQLDLLWRNPAEAVEAPQPERREVEPMKVEILERALSVVATSDLLMPTLLAVGAGMRRGEGSGSVGATSTSRPAPYGCRRRSRRTRSRGGHSPGRETHRSRVFHLPSFVLDALRAHRKAQSQRRLLCGPGWVDHDLVVDRADGSPMRP